VTGAQPMREPLHLACEPSMSAGAEDPFLPSGGYERRMVTVVEASFVRLGSSRRYALTLLSCRPPNVDRINR